MSILKSALRRFTFLLFLAGNSLAQQVPSAITTDPPADTDFPASTEAPDILSRGAQPAGHGKIHRNRPLLLRSPHHPASRNSRLAPVATCPSCQITTSAQNRCCDRLFRALRWENSVQWWAIKDLNL